MISLPITVILCVIAAALLTIAVILILALRALRHIANDLCAVGMHYYILNEEMAEHDETCRTCDPDHDWSEEGR